MHVELICQVPMSNIRHLQLTGTSVYRTLASSNMLPESMEFVSKGGGNCKYRNMTVKATGWKLKVMPFVGLEFASSGN